MDMADFLTIALYVVGIPSIILSILVTIKITRSFYEDHDYDREMPYSGTESSSSENVSHAEQAGAAQKQESGQTQQHHQPRETIDSRVVQSG